MLDFYTSLLDENVTLVSLLTIIIMIFGIYLVPTWMAIKKIHPDRVPIIFINILAGWAMGIGWVVGLVWVMRDPKKIQNNIINPANEIEKLQALKDEIDKLYASKEKEAVPQAQSEDKEK